MTDTTITESVSLERGSLVLVTVSDDYLTTGMSAPGMSTAPSSVESRTYYATKADANNDGYVCLVVPTTDPRHRGMWALYESAVGGEVFGSLTGVHYGWNVETRYVTLTPVDTPPDPISWVRMNAGSPVAVGDRVRYIDARGAGDASCEAVSGDLATVTHVAEDGDLIRVTFDDGHESLRSRFRFERGETPEPFTYLGHTVELDKDKRTALPIEEAYPVGSVWNHFESTRAVVTGYRGDRYLTVTATDVGSGVPANNNPQEWIRGALDLYGTFVGWDEAQTTPQDVTESSVTADESTGGTFTQEHVDAAVRQALEEFKERANRIAVEYAEANQLCGNFERAMDDIGLLGREEWHEQYDESSTYDVSFVVTVRGVEADSESDAQDKARDELYNELPSNMDDDIQHYSTYCRD